MIKFIALRKCSKQLRMDQAARMDAVQSQKRVNEGLFILNNGFHVFAPVSHCLRCSTTIYPLRASTQCTSSLDSYCLKTINDPIQAWAQAVEAVTHGTIGEDVPCAVAIIG